MHPRTALIVPVLALALAGCGSDEPEDGLNVGDSITEEDREVLDQLAAANEEIENMPDCIELIEDNATPALGDGCITDEGLFTAVGGQACGSGDGEVVTLEDEEREDSVWLRAPSDTEWQLTPDDGSFYDIVSAC